MERPKICAVIVNSHPGISDAVLPLIDLFEVRIDLIGDGWQEVVKNLKKPWLACNRSQIDGGKGEKNEEARIAKLLEASQLGASIVDLELSAENLNSTVPEIKKKAQCLISYHNWQKTPPIAALKEIVARQVAAGADICKVVTTAGGFEDNLTVLRLIRESPKTRVVSIAMGAAGTISRILSPVSGGYFTYASLERGGESAPGQVTAAELREIYALTGAG
ncbi:MAG: type I 3-dehydroquinate dehydratase [Chloroflexota bacterium]